MNLTRDHYQALRWAEKQTELVWCGVYEGGGDDVVAALEAAGYIERVAEPVRAGRLNFSGGYRITPAGRAALEKETRE